MGGRHLAKHPADGSQLLKSVSSPRYPFHPGADLRQPLVDPSHEHRCCCPSAVGLDSTWRLGTVWVRKARCVPTFLSTGRARDVGSLREEEGASPPPKPVGGQLAQHRGGGGGSSFGDRPGLPGREL